MRPLEPVATRPGQPAASSGGARDPLLPVLAFPPLVFSLFAFMAELHDSATMLFLSVLSFSAAAIAFVRCYLGLGRRNDMPLFILYAALMFWFYYPCLAGGLSDEQWSKAAAVIEIDNRHALTALLAINLFTFLLAVGNQVRFPQPLARRVRRWMGARAAPTSQRLFLLVLTAMLAGLAFYVVVAGGPAQALRMMLASRAESKPWDREGYQGSSLSLADVVIEATLVAFSALAFHLALDSDQPLRRRLTLAFVALLTVAWVAIERGTRSILLEVALPPLGIYYARVATRVSAARVWRISVLLGMLVALIVAAQFQREYRQKAVIEDVEFKVENNDFFTQTAYAVAVQEAEGRYFHDSALLHIISGPVPRIVWPNKPVMEGMFVFTEYLWGFDTRERGGNTTPSVVGEYYMNWGWWGVVEIGLVLGLLVRLLDLAFRASASRDLARFGILGIMAYIFIDFRMLSFGFFPPMAMTVILAALLARLPWFQTGGAYTRSAPSPGALPLPLTRSRRS